MSEFQKLDAISKKHVPFWENTISANETVCDLLKKGYESAFLCTPSDADFKNNFERRYVISLTS